MRGVLGDLRFAARALARTPGLVLVATISLALGVGVNTTLFSAVKAVLFADATASAPDRLASLRVGGPRSISYPNLTDIRQARIFADVAGYQMSVFSVRGGAEAERAVGEIVTGNYFEVLGVPASIGRTFSSLEARPEQDPRVVVLSHGFWRRHVAGGGTAGGRALRLGSGQASSAPADDGLGRTITINGQPFTIVGVLPPDFQSLEGFGVAPEIYVPVSRALVATLEHRDGFAMRAIGRLRDGGTREQARAALAVLARDLERAYPVENRGFARGGAQLFGISATERLREAGGVAPAMIIAALLAVVSAIVLFSACGNIAGLLLVRGMNRRREIAMRLALGASRARIVRHLLAESLLLAIAGTACGWLLNRWTPALLTGFSTTLPLALPLEFRFEQGLGLLPLELVFAAAAMLLCGLSPALQSTRVALLPALKETPGTGPGSRLKRRARSAVWQVAGAMVQLVVALLFLRTLSAVVRVDPGFAADRLLNASITLDSTRFTRERALAYLDAAVQQVAALPGVEAASAATLVPLSGWSNEADIEPDGRPGARVAGARLNAVSPGYFRTMGIAVARGRDFTSSDGGGSAGVAILGETLAGRLFPNGDAIGRRVRIDTAAAVEVVGVVHDSKYGSLGEAPQPLVYRPLAQDFQPVGTVLEVRTAGAPAAMTATVKRALARVAPDVPVAIRPMRDFIDLSLAPIRSGVGILAIMAGCGMLLTLVGLYGLVSHDVARRTHEFGIRMSLGASPGDVRRGVLSDALRLLGYGIGLGVLMSLALARVLAGSVASLESLDAVTVVVPALLLVLAGLAASYLPARRATRVDPAVALRCE